MKVEFAVLPLAYFRGERSVTHRSGLSPLSLLGDATQEAIRGRLQACTFVLRHTERRLSYWWGPAVA